MVKKQQTSSLISQIPPPVLRLVEIFHKNNIQSTLVGGSVRDFFLNRIRSTLDLDIEIRHHHPHRHIGELVEKWGQGAVEHLPFNIIRLTMEGLTLELAPPRRESYPQGDWFKHDQFEAAIEPELDPSQAWLRRDFTVNAIGIELLSGKLVDPFNGMEDLENKILRHCGSDFFFDPVRFLRLLRFQSRFGFTLHPDMESDLSRFNLKGLSSHYFFKESLLIPFFPFVKNFFDTVQKYSIEIPEELKRLEFLRSLSLPSPENIDDLLMTLIYAPSPPSHNQLEQFVKYAKMATRDICRHTDFRQNLEQIRTVDKKFLMERGRKIPLQDFFNLPQWQGIKRVYRFLAREKGRHPFSHCLESVNPSLHKSLSQLQEIFPPELEGNTPFPDQLPPQQREDFRLYRHLMRD